MASRPSDILSLYERNQEATLYVGNVDPQVDEELLWEFFVQVGVVKNVHIPRDKVTGHHQGYGFVEFETEDDAEYAVRILNFVKLYNKPLRCNKASRDKHNFEVGANLFIGNIDDEVDEKLLHDTFSSFGTVLSAKVVRDTDSADGKSYAFVSYDNFESSDAALAAMNGQFLCNKPIHVSYAYKKDTKGERHGSAAERLIAANRPNEFLNQMGISPYGTTNQMQTSMPIQYVPPATAATPGMAIPSSMQQNPIHMIGSVDVGMIQPSMYQSGIGCPPVLPQTNITSVPMPMPPLPMQSNVPIGTLPLMPQNMPPPPPMYTINQGLGGV